MAARVIHLLGVSHPDKVWLAEQLALALSERGHPAQYQPDPWFEHWQGCSQMPDAPMLHLLNQHINRAPKDEGPTLGGPSLILLTQSRFNWWGISTCLGLDAGSSTEPLADLEKGFMTLLMAAPVGGERSTGGFKDGVSAHRLEDELRRVLYRAKQPYAPLWGEGEARLAQALLLIEHALDQPARLERAARGPRWRWLCESCDDAACEHASLNLPAAGPQPSRSTR